MKIRLLIASPDLDYTEYLSKVLVEKYADVFEVSVCSNEVRLSEMVSGSRADIVLAEAELASSVGLHAVRLPLIFSDERTRGGMSGESYKRIKKYQRISYLVKEMIGAYAEVSSNSEVYGSLSAQITAFWSPVGGSGKTASALAYAANCVAQGKKTAYLDLQNFSCSSIYFQQNDKSISTLFQKLDSNVELLLQSIRQQDSGSGILYFSQPENYDDMNILTCEDIRNLVDGCAKGVDELVIDLSSVCNEKICKILDFANQIFIVLDGSRTGSAKWSQFQTQNNVYEQIRSKVVLVGNKGAALDASSVNGLVSLPFVQSSDPVAVYKTLSASFSK